MRQEVSQERNCVCRHGFYPVDNRSAGTE